MGVLAWIKNNKLAALLLVVLSFLLLKGGLLNYRGLRTNIPTSPAFDYGIGNESISLGAPTTLKRGAVNYPIQQDYAPAPEVTDRKVIQESYLSLQVRNVRETADKIISYSQTIGGYMVNSFLQNPGESPTGNITVRVPAKQIDETLQFLRSLAIKVVSENLSGQDVTDQYVDIDARLATLNKTKAKFEDTLERAAEISDILNIQREIINLQQQIDNLKGQQQFLDKSAQMAKITIYLSTDEYELPFAPSDSWRPNVIFKQAVRSLVINLRKIASLLIWIIVWSVVWVPVLIIIILIRRRTKQ